MNRLKVSTCYNAITYHYICDNAKRREQRKKAIDFLVGEDVVEWVKNKKLRIEISNKHKEVDLIKNKKDQQKEREKIYIYAVRIGDKIFSYNEKEFKDKFNE